MSNPATHASDAEDSVAAAQRKDARFFRTALPLAAAVAIGVGGFWWWITLDQAREPLATLRDGKRKIVVTETGDAGVFRSLPAAIHQALVETLRTGQVPLALERHADSIELEEWTRAAGGSHLVLGVANARAGLREEAEREFRALANQNPGSSLAQKLAAQVQPKPPADPIPAP
ncbi:MAG: hypothetical protein ABI883_07370 [Chthoniobacterales bacterium]